MLWVAVIQSALVGRVWAQDDLDSLLNSIPEGETEPGTTDEQKKDESEAAAKPSGQPGGASEKDQQASGATPEPYPEAVPVPQAKAEPQPAQAAPAHRPRQVEEIVVTATRKAESLQDVNIAVSAFTPEAMKDNVLQDVGDLGRITPSLNFSQSPAQGLNPIISLRGQVQNDPSVLTLDPSVGVYLDEVYLGRAPGSLMDFFDVERVEVLKGPQGTLYGRNTTGGAIRVIPKKADPDAGWDGFLRGSIGNYGSREVEGATNIPLLDNLAFRAGLSSRTLDGWGKQYLTSSSDADEIIGEQPVNDKDNLTGRLSGIWKATDALGFELLADYTDQQTHGASFYEVSGDLGHQAVPGGPVSGYSRSSNDFYTFASDNPNQVAAKTVGASLKGSYELPFGTFKVIHSRRNLKYHFDIDPDASSVAGVVYDARQDVDQDSTELQLLGDVFDGRLNYVIGAYDYTEDGNERSRLYATDAVAPAVGGSLPPQILPLLGSIPIGGPGSVPVINAPDGRLHSISESQSLFVQLTYNFTDALGLTAGVRPIRDTKTMRRSVIDTGAANLLVGPGLTPGGTFGCIYRPGDKGVTNDGQRCEFFNSTNYSYLAYTAGLDWHTDSGVLIYGKTSRGARSGGQQARGTDSASLQPFNPEFVRDFEIGVKGDYFDGMLRANVALYHTDYSEFQVSQLVGVSTVVRNASSAKINGVELETVLALTDTVTLSASGSMIDFKFDDPTYVAAYAPKWQYSGTAAWKQPVGFGNVGASLNYSWKDDTKLYPFAARTNVNPNLTQEAYALVSASAFLEWERYGLRVGLFGSNLTDEEYVVATLPSLIIFDPAVGGGINPGSPRTFGIEIVKSFGKQ